MAGALLLSGCGVTLGDVGDGVWDVTVWTVKGTGKVVKTVAVTTLDVTGAVARKAVGEAADTAVEVERADLPVTPAGAAVASPVPAVRIR